MGALEIDISKKRCSHHPAEPETKSQVGRKLLGGRVVLIIEKQTRTPMPVE